ncbi:MAG: cytochrome d ubiquinol oxidase subunit II [Solirubrobacterales bacterium]|nr:cytochrome d ubiquinol oxidase subunit II [Solirubrobacterales bacterium]
MSLADAVAAVLIAGVTAYAVLGGADFGAGFWDLTAGGARRGARLRGLIKRSMHPVWEANHVWLIFLLVVFWTGFPTAFGAVMSTLYVPLFFAVVGIVLRGTAFAVRGEASTIGEARVFGAAFALSSVLVPFCFGVTIGAIVTGHVEVPADGADAIASWAHPVPIYIGVLAVVTGAYLAAVFLAADAVRAGLPDLVDAFRTRALVAAAVAGAMAIGGIFVVRDNVPALYDGLTSGAGLAVVIGSVVAGAITLALVWGRHFGLARWTSTLAVGAIIVGLAIAQAPDFLPGELTLEQAAAGDPTLIALLVFAVVAVLVLVPSLALLYRLTLRGDLDSEFHPIVAADREEQR